MPTPPLNAQQFRDRQRRLLGRAAQLYSDLDLDSYRDGEIEELYAKYIRKSLTDASHTAAAGQLFYKLPTNFTKVRRVEFWDVNPEIFGIVPDAPTLASGAAGNPNGNYFCRVTFVI